MNITLKNPLLSYPAYSFFIPATKEGLGQSAKNKPFRAILKVFCLHRLLLLKKVFEMKNPFYLGFFFRSKKTEVEDTFFELHTIFR